MNSRSWSIRSKIVSLVAVPIAALMALWIFATTLTLGPALSLLSTPGLLDNVGEPAEAVVAALQKERRLSLVYLAGRGPADELNAQRTETDRAIAEFRRLAVGADTSELLAGRIRQLDTALDVLPSGRSFIDRRDMDKAGALGLYNGIVDSAFRAFAVLTDLPDETISREGRAITQLGLAREVLGRADALLAGVFTGGKFAADEYGQLVQIVGTQRFLYDSAIAELPEADRTAYGRLKEGAAFTQLDAMINSLVTRGRANAAPPVDAAAWSAAYDEVQSSLRDFELAAAGRLTERSTPVAAGILARLGLAGILGLAAVVIAIYFSVRVGRGFIQRVSGLRAAALELAGDRLPSVVARLRQGQDVDVAVESPPLEFGTDELGQLGHAFGAVQRTAVTSAVDEAALRRGLSEVFLNIARRSQTLLHRQLALLDKMERRTTNPDELADLFRIDHMATRMRRHAEDLVVLAGAAPGRGWRVPVPMIDVIRGAVSEVEDYPRVNILAVETAAVAGRAVGDVIHLLAELIENATSFSPPHTRVHVAGQVVPNGYAIEIEDRGLGMTQEAIDEANLRLSEPPDFDPANSARLGLFVVAQLGARHGVRVQLRSSPYGGVTAVALLPTDLIAPGAGALALPGRTTGDVPVPGGGVLNASPPNSDGAAADSPVWTVGRAGHVGRHSMSDEATSASDTGRAETPAQASRTSPGVWATGSYPAHGEALAGPTRGMTSPDGVGVAGGAGLDAPSGNGGRSANPTWPTALSGGLAAPTTRGDGGSTAAGTGSPAPGGRHGNGSSAAGLPGTGSSAGGLPGSGSAAAGLPGSSFGAGSFGAGSSGPGSGSAPTGGGFPASGGSHGSSYGGGLTGAGTSPPSGPPGGGVWPPQTPAQGLPPVRRRQTSNGQSAPGTAAPTPALGLPTQRRRAVSESTAELVVGEDGLPRRTRQRHLAPQLRRPNDPSGDPDTSGAFAAGIGDRAASLRSPDEVRARMSALQAGTARGRQQHTPPPAGEPTTSSGTASTVPLPTPPAAEAASTTDAAGSEKTGTAVTFELGGLGGAGLGSAGTGAGTSQGGGVSAGLGSVTATGLGPAATTGLGSAAATGLGSAATTGLGPAGSAGLGAAGTAGLGTADHSTAAPEDSGQQPAAQVSLRQGQGTPGAESTAPGGQTAATGDLLAATTTHPGPTATGPDVPSLDVPAHDTASPDTASPDTTGVDTTGVDTAGVDTTSPGATGPDTVGGLAALSSEPVADPGDGTSRIGEVGGGLFAVPSTRPPKAPTAGDLPADPAPDGVSQASPTSDESGKDA